MRSFSSQEQTQINILGLISSADLETLAVRSKGLNAKHFSKTK